MTMTQELRIESLDRARNGQSLLNYGSIYQGFLDMGISEDDIEPRVNVFTYNAWLALGRQVRKGQHGVRVVTWINVDGKLNAETGKIEGAGKYCRSSTVFHVSQTDPITGEPKAPQRTTPTAPPSSAKPVSNRAAQFRKMADGLQKRIDERLRPMSQNPTPKRNLEYNSRRLEGNNLSALQDALRAMAIAIDSGTLPASLADVSTKEQAANMTRRKYESSGYYDIHAGDYADNGAAAIELRNLVKGLQSPEAAKQAADRAQAQKIAEMEEKLRFCNIPGFFPTPQALIVKMLERAHIQPGDSILEPSAGKGDIADAARLAGGIVEVVECQYSLREILTAKGHKLVGDDYLDRHAAGQYDKVLMNPPFENGQDAEHVRRAYENLKPGGKLIAIMSEGSFFRSDAKATAFRAWLESVGGISEQNEADSFGGVQAFRQTGTATRLVEIVK